MIAVRGTFDDAPGEFDRMEELLAGFADANGLPASALYDFNVVLDEVVSNILKYGYPHGARKEVRLQLSLGNGVVAMEVEDDGASFDPLQHPPPDPSVALADRTVGGLGVHLVRRLMDEVSYARVGNSNRLTVRKRLAG